MEDSMSKLSSAFDVDNDDFETDTSAVLESLEKEIEVITDKKNALTMKAKEPLGDYNFVTSEIKSLIFSSRSVLNTLEQDIQVGASARMYEVYAQLLNSVTGTIRELIQMNQGIAELHLKDKKIEKTDGKRSLTAEKVMDIIANAVKERTPMDAVDAEFTIEEEEISKHGDPK